MAIDWKLAQIWDEAFEQPDEPIKAREYLYASEVGYGFLENWLKMRGEPFSNTFTASARKKMEAGKLFESVVIFVLKRAGLLKDHQTKVDYALPGCISVHGKLDVIAGGEIDLGQADRMNTLVKFMFEELAMPKIYLKIADKVLQTAQELVKEEGSVLALYVHEVKSVSQYVWDLLEAQNKAMLTHRMQIGHYIGGGVAPEGRITYINREDVRIKEFQQVANGEETGLYRTYMEKMSDYARSSTMPPKEPLITYNADALKFNKNTIGVEWSKYLTKIYGYSSPTAFREEMTPIVKSLNYAFKRCVMGDNLTKKNLEAIAEAKKRFPDWDNMVDIGKLRKTIIAENEEVENEKE